MFLAIMSKVFANFLPKISFLRYFKLICFTGFVKHFSIIFSITYLSGFFLLILLIIIRFCAIFLLIFIQFYSFYQCSATYLIIFTIALYFSLHNCLLVNIFPLVLSEINRNIFIWHLIKTKFLKYCCDTNAKYCLLS